MEYLKMKAISNKLTFCIIKATTQLSLASTIQNHCVNEEQAFDKTISFTPEEAEEAIKTALRKAKEAIDEVLKEEKPN